MTESKGFKDIIFGKAAAEKEKTPAYKRLLLEGFFDAYDYTKQLLYADKFLVLGLKGSGKSAIAARLELLSKEDTDLIVTNYDISAEFPHRLFSHLMELYKNEAQITKFQYYWEYLILIVFLENFSKDSTSVYKNINLYNLLIKSLEFLELMPTSSFSNLVAKTTESNFEEKLVKHLKSVEQFDDANSASAMNYIFHLLRDVCFSISCKKKHILVIDGLDSILTPQIQQNNIIAALILIADSINNHFIENGIDAKVILLCRTDLFDILPGANLNKIKQDSTIILN